MSQQQKNQFLPMISIVLIIVTLFALVFLQMEVRRMGYLLLKQTREYKELQDLHRMNVMRYAKVMRPERLRELAVTKLTLNDIKSHQIIHMSGEKIVLRQ